MSTAASLIVPSNSTRHMNTWSSYRCQAIISNPVRLSAISKQKKKFEFLRNQSLQSFNVKYVVVYSSALPEPPLSSDPSPHSWKLWILGMLISAVLPFWRSKWGPFQRLKNQVDAALETAEHVAEILEDVAEEVEKVADEVADHLPQGGKLKEAVTFIENVAKETAKDSHRVDEFIEKIKEAAYMCKEVEQVENDVESLIDPIISQASEATKE